METSKLFDNAQAARYLGVSPAMLRLSRHSGELFKGVPAPEFLKLGAAVRYPKENLDDWLQKQPRYRSNAEVASAREDT